MSIKNMLVSESKRRVGVKLALAVAGAGLCAAPAFSQNLQPPAQQEASSLPRISNAEPRGLSRADVESRVANDVKPARQASRERSAFQTYVEGVTGTKLEIFGSDLFTDVPNTFAPLNAVQVNADYVIGSGDELHIRGWGMIDIDLTVTVDRAGAIHIPRVGSVNVAGVRYRDLQGHLKQAVQRVFSNFELTASIAQTRAVQVYVVGHAARPGTYTLNAMSTLLNALFASGGPSATGTMRNVQLKRGSQTVTTFDVYDMLVRGDKSRDVPLQDGDVLFIPEIGPLVALTGNVKRPGIFELKDKASVADALTWSGGFESAAELKQVVVEKSVNNTFQAIADFVPSNGGGTSPLSSLPIQPADVYRVFAPGAIAVQAQVRNEYVRVYGEASSTGIFKIGKGETLRELMARLGGVSENGYLYALQLNRESIRQAQQARLDEVADRFERDIEATARQRLSGKANAENQQTILAELEQQRVIAQRLRTIRAQGRIVLELPGAEAQVKHLPDIALNNGDSIFIPRKPGTVDVLGSVFQQGTFIYRPGRSVSDYLALAGGQTVTADASETYVLRADGSAQSGRGGSWFAGIGGVSLNPGDTIVVPEKIDRSTWRQELREWTTILYQFGLGAAGLKVLRD